MCRGEQWAGMKCNSIQMLCLYSSPYSMYSDHVFCSDHYDFCLFIFLPLHWWLLSVLCYCGRVCLCTWLFLFFSCGCMIRLSICVSVCLCVSHCAVALPIMPLHPTRVPGGECRQWGRDGGRGHPWDQCDRCGRRANAQRRLPAAATWRPRPARLRRPGRRLRGQPGPPRAWLRHEGSGGQEAEVCEADGGEWGFWVGLHREEPVLRPCPSFPPDPLWGILGNHVWGRGLKSCMMTSPFTFLRWAPPTSLRLITLFLSSVCQTSLIHLLSPLWLKLLHEDLLPRQIQFIIKDLTE